MSTGQIKVRLAACAIYRNEARYLREWIEFHLLVGIERFYLYDNESQDDHLAVLEPYIAEGIVVLERWPISPGQHLAYEHCVMTRRDEARWIAYFDLDEFLFSPTGESLPVVLEAFEAYPGVVVNMALFGTSGHKTEPEGLVIENYMRRSPEECTGNRVKSIVDPRCALHCWGAHSFYYLGWTREFEGATFAEPVYGPVLPVSERQVRVQLRTHAMTDELSYSLLRINHYWTKSEDVFREKWAKRRSDTGALREPISDAHLELLSVERDDAIQIYAPALTEAIRRRELGMSTAQSSLDPGQVR